MPSQKQAVEELKQAAYRAAFKMDTSKLTEQEKLGVCWAAGCEIVIEWNGTIVNIKTKNHCGIEVVEENGVKKYRVHEKARKVNGSH